MVPPSPTMVNARAAFAVDRVVGIEVRKELRIGTDSDGQSCVPRVSVTLSATAKFPRVL